MSEAPDRIWWSAAEIAAASLPGLPGTKRRVNDFAQRHGWDRSGETCRRRAGRGGGLEYHWSLLPEAARAHLLAQLRPRGIAPAPEPREEAWTQFDALPDSVKAKAWDRLRVIAEIEDLERDGWPRREAVEDLAARQGISGRTIWNWLAMVEGVRADDRLAYLVPRHQCAARKTGRADCTPEAWEAFKADYLRLERPSFTACYRRVGRIAARKGWVLPSEATLRRRIEAEISRVGLALARKGPEAAKRMVIPPQKRDKTRLHALEVVNVDFHRWDVFVDWGGEICRPQMVAFQDVHSGLILSWRMARTPNKTDVQLAFGELVEDYGVPDHLVADNGREFANKLLTGGAAQRFRFKVRDDDIPGLFTSMGVQIHFTTPYSGQSKPIERAFRDFCDDIARDPRLAGAWTGNRPDAKPENYASRAIPMETFERVVAEGILEHNARTGRRGQTAQGSSFLKVFEASYADAPIRRATAEQRRLWLMGAEGIRAHREHGELGFCGNGYWAEFLTAHAGEKLVIRFDTGALRAGLHVYDLAGRYLGHAPCVEAAGFLDLDGARTHNRLRRALKRAEAEALKAARGMNVIELAALMDETAPVAPEPPARGTVVRGAFGGGAATAAAMLPEAEVAEPGFDREDVLDRMGRGIRLIYPDRD